MARCELHYFFVSAGSSMGGAEGIALALAMKFRNPPMVGIAGKPMAVAKLKHRRDLPNASAISGDHASPCLSLIHI